MILFDINDFLEIEELCMLLNFMVLFVRIVKGEVIEMSANATS